SAGLPQNGPSTRGRGGSGHRETAGSLLMSEARKHEHSSHFLQAKALEKALSERGFEWIGKGIPNREAEMKAAGEILYVDDLRMSGMLHAKILLSPHAHARINAIDTSKAEALPGVRAVVHAFNTPRILYNS